MEAPQTSGATYVCTTLHAFRHCGALVGGVGSAWWPIRLIESFHVIPLVSCLILTLKSLSSPRFWEPSWHLEVFVAAARLQWAFRLKLRILQHQDPAEVPAGTQQPQILAQVPLIGHSNPKSLFAPLV